MTKKIYLETLKSFMGHSILHYLRVELMICYVSVNV